MLVLLREMATALFSACRNGEMLDDNVANLQSNARAILCAKACFVSRESNCCCISNAGMEKRFWMITNRNFKFEVTLSTILQ